MRCFSCHRLSIKAICPACRDRLFVPTIKKRKIGTLDVISFYRYSTIESLLLLKHKPEGYRVFRDLAEMTIKPFIRNFVENDPSSVSIVGIDEQIKNGYSHVACMTEKMKTAYSKPLHASLLSQNSVRYAGKTLQYRLNNPRNFKYSGNEKIDVILVDDIITTGITLQEAQQTLLASNVNVLFALTLADAQE
ncbi:MAG: ComF family protein [Campylobacterota bacterium]|nr:ComF family protein [Campylobacterota bacterium]